MPAHISVTQMRAERAEDLQDLWDAIWADDECTPAERAEMRARLAAAVTDWSQQVVELAYIHAFIGGGLPAFENRNTRVMKLTREGVRDGRAWPRTADEVEDAVMIAAD